MFPSSRRIRIVLAGLALAAILQAGATRADEEPKQATIDRSGVLILVRTTLLAVDAANKTGNYTVLRDLAAPGFAASNTAARLGDVFASNRRDGIDLSGVAVLDPQLTRLPEMEKNGMMRMSGFFPSIPKQVNFDLLYQPIGGQWRLFGISLNVGPSGPVAPTPPPTEVAAVPPHPPKPAKVARQDHKSTHVKKAEPEVGPPPPPAEPAPKPAQ